MISACGSPAPPWEARPPPLPQPPPMAASAMTRCIILLSVSTTVQPHQRSYKIVRRKRHQVICALTQSRVANRKAQLSRHGYRDTALCRTVQLGQDDPVYSQRLAETTRLDHPVAAHGCGHDQ